MRGAQFAKIAKIMAWWDRHHDKVNAGVKFNPPIPEFYWTVYHKYWKPRQASGWKNLGRRYTAIAGHVKGKRY